MSARAKALRQLGQRLNRVDPFRGTCAFCGGADARHRVWDSVRGTLKAERGRAKVVARWYAVPVALVRLVRQYANRTLEAAGRAALASRVNTR